MTQSARKSESGTHPARLTDRHSTTGSGATPRRGELPRVSEVPEQAYELLQGEKAMTPEKYVPDYIIYDELKRQRQERASREERPRLEMPRYIPYWPDAGFGEPGEDHSKEEDESDSQERGVVIIQMC